MQQGHQKAPTDGKGISISNFSTKAAKTAGKTAFTKQENGVVHLLCHQQQQQQQQQE